MQKRKKSSSESDPFEPIPPRIRGGEGSPAPPTNKRGSSPVPDTFNYAPVGAGAAAARSSKGGKSGGGMGGQQAGGIKGGGKRKTHAGNK